MDIRRAVFSEEAASRLSVSNLRGKAYIPPMFDVSKISWICRGRDVVCGPRTLIMGILNVTPDSFSDGGKFQSLEKAVAHGLQMVADGADVIDLGGESTRPGAEPVSVAEEIRRTVPVVGKLREETDVLISIDTQKAAVAQAALDAGADIVNDVSALADPDMAGVVSGSGAGLILMHMRGIPRTMQRDPRYDDVVSNVRNFLQERMALAMNHGVLPEQLVLDPGIGFGKTDEHNLALLNGIPALAGLGRPVMVGVSRKSLIGRLLGREPDERLAGSLALAVFSILNGARLLRVHDVKESCDAARLSDRMRAQGINDGLVEQN
ncbi:MAG: dihydropteroate synthase [Pontiellaceae bacterium]|jgi:dihydropteroate synthase|nr:dihydropteroate synthase [Pontiellaceae bacterium]